MGSILAEHNQLQRNDQGIWVLDDAAAFHYSDGEETESYLGTVFEKTEDLGCYAVDLEDRIIDWPSEYHLSFKRYNLLRFLYLQDCKRVLELGCGCGAISRYLGEQGIEVDAVEGSAVRASLAQSRCRDLENVNIINANYNDLKLPALAYDAVVFIGVLEYAGRFVEGADSHEAAVRQILNAVKLSLLESGVAIIAIENRLGLKYLYGAGEDHYAKPYMGLYGYPGKSDIKTYSLGEWKQLIKDSDFPCHEFAYCFPDYKIPSTIVADNFLQDPDNRIHLLDTTNSRDYVNLVTEFANEGKMLKGFVEAGQLAEFSNSFLMVLGQNSDSVAHRMSHDFLHSSDYSRRPEFRTITLKSRQQNRLQKYPLFPESGNKLLSQNLEVTDYCSGELLSNIWARDLEIENNSDAFIEHLRAYLEFVGKTLAESGQNGQWIDLLPFNIVVGNEGQFIAIDQEWHYHKEFDQYYLLFRALFYFVGRYKHCFVPVFGEQAGVGDILKASFQQLGLENKLENWSAYIQLEDQLQKIIRSPQALSSTRLELAQNIGKYKFHPAIYWRKPTEPTDRNKSLTATVSFGKERQEIEFHFTHQCEDDEAIELRFDPAEQEGFFHIYHLKVVTGFDINTLDQVRIDYTGQQLAENSHLQNVKYGHNRQQDIFVSSTDDPQIVIRRPIKLKKGEITKISICMDWPKSDDYRMAQSLYIAEKDAMQRQHLTMEDELQRLRVVEEELKLVKQSRIWRMAENLRQLIYIDMLGKVPKIQSFTLRLSRRNWRKIADENSFMKLDQAPDPYVDVIVENTLSSQQKSNIDGGISQFAFRPRFSFVMPTYNPAPDILEAAIESIKNQLYQNWELCLVDDASTEKSTRKFIASINHPKIRIRENSTNQNIAATTNCAIEMATGDYIVFMDNDDVLTEDALYELAKLINEKAEPGIIYSDEDFLKESGERINPHFKPDFSPDLLLSHNYMTHLVAMKRSLVEKTGPLDSACDGAQDYDYLLRATELSDSIHHIPKILYHWRMSRSSTSMDSEAKPEAINAAKKALIKALDRRGIDGEVLSANLPHFFRVKRRINSKEKISIVIPFKDRPDLLKICIDSILERSTYSNFEIIGISNNSDLEETFELMQSYRQLDERISFYEHNIAFNFSAVVNFGAGKAKGKHLLIMNNDIEIISWDWLEAMLEHSLRPEIGAVGAKLYYANNTVQHAGIVVGIGGYAGHGHKHLAARNTGYFNRLNVIQNVSAVTGALFMVKKTLYEEMGGFDETVFKIACNDVDFCLRLMAAGYRNLFTPYAKAYHYESSSRGYEDTPEKQTRFAAERQRFQERHAGFLDAGDPFYNPNLTLTEEHFGLKLIQE